MESAVNKAKSLAQEVSNRHREEKDVFEDDTPAQSTMQYVKVIYLLIYLFFLILLFKYIIC